MNPKISVVIPTRNEGGYIEKTLAQYIPLRSRFNLEIVISDGNSTDDTVERARKLADQVVTAEPGKKQNIPIGRNAGCFKARGEIIFSTDADVEIPDIENFFEHMIRQFDDAKVVGAMTPLRIYPREERLDDKIVHFIFNTSIKFSTYFGSFLSKGECQFIRAESFRAIGGYDETIVAGEDCDLFYRLAKIGKIAYDSSLVVYHSPRRFRKDGYVKTLAVYIREGFSLFFTGKSHVKEWTVVR